MRRSLCPPMLARYATCSTGRVMRTLLRVLAAGAALGAALSAALLFLGRRWRRRAEVRLALGSVVAQTARGPIEYAILGEGEPAIVFHGTPGGYDQAIAVGEAVRSARLRIIAPSRPGYLRTPIATGRTPSEQAAAAAALLDEMDVGCVAVIAISGGGPAAVAFATEHPDRVSRLALWGAVTSRMDFDTDRLTNGALTRDAVAWGLLTAVELAPRAFVPAHVAADARAVDLVGTSMACAFPLDLRRDGIDNDARQMALLPSLPLEQIGVPTLIVHGTADERVEVEQSKLAAQRIPGARLVLVEGGTQLSTLIAAEAIDAVSTFLAQARAGEPQPADVANR